MRQVIYVTKGRAREFAELAINLYDFCTHGCVYCYAPLVLHKKRSSFDQGLYSRITLQDVIKSAQEWSAKGETRKILLCFTCDPYMPIEQNTQFTRKTILALHRHNLNVTILTKAGKRAIRDFDLLTPEDSFATTLTCLSNNDSRIWEPNAALPAERIASLQLAHERGIETWISLEPVINPEDTATFIIMTRPFTDHYKLGILNYHPHKETINWHDFGWKIKTLMDKMDIKYYFKADLLKKMGVNPTDFKQTWVCH